MGSTATAIILEQQQQQQQQTSKSSDLMSSYSDDLDFVFRLKNPPENFRKILQIQIRALCGLFKKKEI
jgi:hypothetical protein